MGLSGGKLPSPRLPLPVTSGSYFKPILLTSSVPSLDLEKHVSRASGQTKCSALRVTPPKRWNLL